MTQTLIETRTDQTLDPGILSHIVPPEPPLSARAVVIRARIYGLEVRALCGHTWVPERDPEKYPLCQKCQEIHNEIYGADSTKNLKP